MNLKIYWELIIGNKMTSAISFMVGVLFIIIIFMIFYSIALVDSNVAQVYNSIFYVTPKSNQLNTDNSS